MMKVLKNLAILFGLLAFSSSYINLAYAQESVREIPVAVVAVDVESNTVTLAGLGFPEKEYRMAFDIEIKLINGTAGSVSGLQINDRVTAIVGVTDAVVHALHVVAKP